MDHEFFGNDPFRHDDIETYRNLHAIEMGNFSRQDSLTIAAQLQEQDKERNPDSFMEADVNIDYYLKNLQDEEAFVEDPIQTDPDVAKSAFTLEQTAAYNSMNFTQAMHEIPDDDDDFFQAPHSSRTTQPNTNYSQVSMKKVKEEIPDEISVGDESVHSFESYSSSTVSKSKYTKDVTYTPTTKARKYQLKPKEEKETVTYKIKRMRNNDAVRRSRMKAKEQQEIRDRELRILRNEKAKLEAELRAAKHKLEDFTKKCRCRVSLEKPGH